MKYETCKITGKQKIEKRKAEIWVSLPDFVEQTYEKLTYTLYKQTLTEKVQKDAGK
ncbi:MAG: hypothetical protein LBG92_05060 [Prevotellaceae bacterium]|jgi:hypothetical protein|nr:hypothetical protein [Prevotellaceae bacterium]